MRLVRGSRCGTPEPTAAEVVGVAAALTAAGSASGFAAEAGGVVPVFFHVIHCLNEFTAGQGTRMQQMVKQYRPSL